MKSKTLRKIYFLIASLFSFCGTLVSVGVFFEDTDNIWAFDDQEYFIRRQMDCEREKKYDLNNPGEYNSYMAPYYQNCELYAQEGLLTAKRNNKSTLIRKSAWIIVFLSMFILHFPLFLFFTRKED